MDLFLLEVIPIKNNNQIKGGKLLIKKTLSIAIILALIFTMSSSVLASPASSTSDALKQTQKNKEDLQAKVQNLNSKIDDVLKKIDINKQDMNKLAKDMTDSETNLKLTEDKLKSQQGLLQKRVRAMYMNGKISYLQIIFSSHNFSDLLSNINVFNSVLKFNDNIIKNVEDEKSNVLKQKESLSAASKKLDALKRSNEATLANLNSDINEEKSLLAKTTEKEKELVAKKAEEDEAAQKAAAASNHSQPSGTSVVLLGAPTKAGTTISVLATGYSIAGYTSSGSLAVRNPSGYSTIAVDPRIIPMGTKVYVDGYGYAIASDTGGAIVGYRVDLFFSTEADALNWGARTVQVRILN